MRAYLLLFLTVVCLHAEYVPDLACPLYRLDREACLSICMCAWCQLSDSTGTCLEVGEIDNRTCPRDVDAFGRCPTLYEQAIVSIIFVAVIASAIVAIVVGILCYSRLRGYQTI